MKLKPMLYSLTVTLFVVLWAASVSAGRNTFSNQGFVVDNDGNPLEETYTFTFRLYDAPSGGNLLWEEAQSIAVSEGLYSAPLGAVTSLPEDLADTEGLYLGIQMDGDSEMTPRLEFFTTPYALIADRADGADLADVATIALSVDPSGLAGLLGSGLSLSGNNLTLDTSDSQSWTGSQTFTAQMLLSGNPPDATSASALLRINPPVAEVDERFLVIQDNGSDRFVVDKEGDVAIGGNLAVSGTFSAPGIGDITSVTASTGLSGGGASGAVTLSLDQAFTPTWTGAHLFQSDVDLSLAGTENLSISNSTATTDIVSVLATVPDTSSADALQISITDNTSTSGAARGLVIETGDGSAALDSAIAVVHNDLTQAMTSGLSVTAATGAAVTTAIDLSAAEIGTALALGLNEVTVGGVILSAAEFSYLDGATSNIQTQLNAAGGDITAVSAGTGLTGGGTTGAVTVSLTTPVSVADGGTGAGLSTTGGANQFVKQSTLGGALSVGAVADADVPDNVTISLAAAATALQTDPADCAANQFATAIAASGALTCAALTDADVPNALTISGGTVNSSVIGGTTPAAMTGTTVTANTSLTVGGGTAIVKIKKVNGVAGPTGVATSVTVTDADVSTTSFVGTTSNVTPGGSILCGVDSLAAGSFVYKCTADPADTHTFNYVVANQ